jgi:hypothetical protein
LAEVVFCWKTGNNSLPADRREVAKFRDELGAREPALAVIRDAHDSHKHGFLRPTAPHISQGQRPETVTKFGYFLNI